jgi:phage tail-like protein
MRGAIAGLENRYPLIEYLPSVYADDQFAVRFTAALDEVLAPVVNTIDSIHGYLDPLLAPEDFVRWLAGWFGVVLDESWPMEAQRAVVAESMELFRMRGTMKGLRRHLELVIDGDVEITESGGVSCSVRPRPEPPTGLTHWVTVRVRPSGRVPVSPEAVEAVIRAAKPVHVLHNLEVLRP